MQIEDMRRRIRKQDKKTQIRMQEVKDLIQAQLKDQATRQLQCVSLPPSFLLPPSASCASSA